jgi:hypothetical protein
MYFSCSAGGTTPSFSHRIYVEGIYLYAVYVTGLAKLRAECLGAADAQAKPCSSGNVSYMRAADAAGLASRMKLYFEKGAVSILSCSVVARCVCGANSSNLICLHDRLGRFALTPDQRLSLLQDDGSEEYDPCDTALLAFIASFSYAMALRGLRGDQATVRMSDKNDVFPMVGNLPYDVAEEAGVVAQTRRRFRRVAARRWQRVHVYLVAVGGEKILKRVIHGCNGEGPRDQQDRRL